MPKIEVVKKKKEYEVEETIMKYSPLEIRELIGRDLSSQRLRVTDISFDTGYKYVYDEWGMNKSLTSYFVGITVTVSED